MKQAFNFVAEPLGIPVDYAALLFCLVASIPLSLPLPYLPAQARHFYNMTTSFLFLYVILELHWGFTQLLLMSVVTYTICKLALAGVIKTSFPWPWIAFWFCMAELTAAHAYRYFADVSLDVIEISGPMMVLVMRMSLYAWNVFDREQEQGAKGYASIPLLPFLGYTFFLPCFLIGPGVHYDSYIKLVQAPLPPGRFREATTRFLLGVGFLGLYASVAGQYDYMKLAEGQGGKTLATRILFAQVCGFVARSKYYGIWLISETACIVSGIAQSTNSKESAWGGARNVRILGIELAENFKVLLDNWNCFTNVWLREAIYKRLAKKGSKPGFKSTLMTFVTSAFWHGLNPNYYITFVLGSFISSVARNNRKYIRPLFLTEEQLKNRNAERTNLKTFYDVLGVVSTQLAVNYAVVPFMLMEFKPTMKVWSQLDWYGHIFTFLPLLFWEFGGKTLLTTEPKLKPQYSEAYNAQVQAENDAIPPGIAAHPDAIDNLVKDIAEFKRKEFKQL